LNKSVSQSPFDSFVGFPGVFTPQMPGISDAYRAIFNEGADWLFCSPMDMDNDLLITCKLEVCSEVAASVGIAEDTGVGAAADVETSGQRRVRAVNTASSKDQAAVWTQRLGLKPHLFIKYFDN